MTLLEQKAQQVCEKLNLPVHGVAYSVILSALKNVESQADNTLQSLRDAAIKNRCGTMAARMKNGEVIILVTSNAATPEKDIMTAMMQLFPG